MTSIDEDAFTIQLEDSRDVQMHFEVIKSENFAAVFHQYAKMKAYSIDSLEFKFQGNPVHMADDTPNSLGMSNDQNTIQVSLTGIERTKEIISQACVDGMTSLAVELLSANKELRAQNVRWLDHEGEEMSTPPIFVGIDYGHVELVSNLLPLHDGGMIDTMRAGCGDYTALEWACWVGSLDTVKILVEEGGAKVTEDAMVLARDEGHNTVVDYLETHVDWYAGLEGDADAMMEKACREGDLEKVKQLVDVENYNMEQWMGEDGTCIALAPMYSAVRNGHVELIQYFGEKGMQLS